MHESLMPARSPRPVTPYGILASKLERIRSIVDSSCVVDPDLEDVIDEAVRLATGLEDYLTACTTSESLVLAALARRTRSEDWVGKFDKGATTLPLEQEMLCGHLEGQLLKMLVHATGARRVLEIGVFTGYSALAMAEGLPEEGTLLGCEIDPFVAEFARRCFDQSPHGGKISLAVGPALETLSRLAASGESYDFVFIDADKASYWAYLEKLLSSGLLAQNALVCVDNTLMQGQPYGAGIISANGEAVAEFNRRLSEDIRVEQVLLPIRDGLTLIRRV